MATLTKITHVEAVKKQMLTNEQRAQKVLGWSEQTYCNYKFDKGIEYAEIMTDNDQEGMKFLVGTKFFWSWWKNEWAKRDADFLNYFEGYLPQAEMINQYESDHSVTRLSNNDLMQKKACSMMGYAIDEYMRAQGLEVEV